MDFTIRGKKYEIDRDKVITAVQGAAPAGFDSRNRYYVQIKDQRFPIKQLIGLTTGLPPAAFTAQVAYRVLAKLGFEIHVLGERVSIMTWANSDTKSTDRWPVTLTVDEDGYIVASCPVLPGCHSQGKTKEEALKNISEAIRGYLASLREHGEEVPQAEFHQVEVAL